MIIKNVKALVVLVCMFITNSIVFADTPVDLFESYAGNVNFVGIDATRRTSPTNACAVMPTNNTNSAVVTGIPAGATISAAHLYWAGSGSTPDYTVTFEGTTITAPTNRQYTANYTTGPYNLDFFSGVADVTSQVNIERNGTYTFSGLAVTTGGQHCQVSAVVAGWSLVIIYEDAGEDFRVVNLFEGFQAFRGSSITLTPNNFRVPNSPINGKHATITWEGDAGNSATLGGLSESLVFNGNTLTDATNPANAQFNSRSNIASTAPSSGSPNNNSYGVDYDAYPIGSHISAGDTSATSTYSSGGDLVILSSEIISVTNTPVSDLAISKTASSSFNVGTNATYNIVVNNAGPNPEPGNIVVTDTLPAGLSFVSATGTGWSCSATGQNVTCTRSGNLAVGSSTSNIVLTVAVSSAAIPSVSNTANVTGSNFDNQNGNDQSTAVVSVNTGPNISLQKTTNTISDPINGTTNPKAIPGALAEYTIGARNSGMSPADNNSIIISDVIPSNTALYVGDISGAGSGPLRFVDGSPPSGLSYNFSGLASTSDGLSFSNDNGVTYSYTPSPDAEGVDASVTNIRISTLGQFLAANGSGNPSFMILFRVRVQ